MTVTGVQVPFVDLKAQYAGIRREIDVAIQKVVESAYFVGGPVLERFEAEFAAFCGAKHCVGVANGTDAITLALKALGIGVGDEVIVPANSFFATAEAVSNAGARPVFADVDPATFHIDPAGVEAAVTARTRAIVPVHLYGRAMDMAPIERIASRHDLAIVEDCAQAHGAAHGGKVVGSSGRLCCFSFYPGKNLGAYGDGGAVTVSDPDLDRKLRILRDHGSASKYVHSAVGYNSRLDALQAAVLAVKLPHLAAWNNLRYKHASRIAAALHDSPILPPQIPAPGEHIFHLFVVRCTERDRLRDFLGQRGIQTGIHYPVPLHLTEAYQALSAPCRGAFPAAETLASEILSLPMYAELSEGQIGRVLESLQEFTQTVRPARLERYAPPIEASVEPSLGETVPR